MTGFIGEYNCKLDAKGRLSLPAGLRKQLDPADQDQFVVNRGLSGNLNLYPLSEWTRVMDKLRKLNRFNAKNLKFVRMFQQGAMQIAIDANGRLLIPKSLMKHAGISKEIVLSANIDQFEIWDKDSYNKLMKEDWSEFADLAEEVMGNLGGDDA
ncbi:MAG TPA: division/cell wall cluster transcriptional repressor MraZ [Flavobacteriales bacterium]|nr:division/cell wall cluster transcriptional repressor MraZ [Crocinitomicaceae bacterium]HAE31657.1 division/cell wall cluster transcriptional repressor MraZ [Flavobacteriales bacterium]|tara:strand:- start:5422 stop:5883 length:462 start_codon:yes stop_codon:yes gene_type:complete